MQLTFETDSKGQDRLITAINNEIDNILCDTYNYSIECNGKESCFINIVRLVKRAYSLHNIRKQIGVSWLPQFNAEKVSINQLHFNYDTEIKEILKDENSKLYEMFNKV